MASPITDSSDNVNPVSESGGYASDAGSGAASGGNVSSAASAAAGLKIAELEELVFAHLYVYPEFLADPLLDAQMTQLAQGQAI